MPKVSRVGKFRAAAKASISKSPLTSQTQEKSLDIVKDGEKETLSRGQRKRLAKREQYLKREKMVLSSLRLQKLEEQKGKIDGLDAIRDALPMSSSVPAVEKLGVPQSSTVEKDNAPLCNTNKSKKTLANAEISHMSLVLEHPSFKENPFAAIQQHLRNSLASQAVKLEEDSAKRTEEENKADAKKKEEKKERIRDAKFSKKRTGKKTVPKPSSRKNTRR